MVKVMVPLEAVWKGVESFVRRLEIAYSISHPTVIMIGSYQLFGLQVEELFSRPGAGKLFSRPGKGAGKGG